MDIKTSSGVAPSGTVTLQIPTFDRTRMIIVTSFLVASLAGCRWWCVVYIDCSDCSEWSDTVSVFPSFPCCLENSFIGRVNLDVMTSAAKREDVHRRSSNGGTTSQFVSLTVSVFYHMVRVSKPSILRWTLTVFHNP
jgi:hypothetical protein